MSQAQDKLAQSDFVHGDHLKDDAEQKHIQQALVLMQQGNYDGAELIYKRLIEKRTKKYVVYSNLAVIYCMKNRIEEMIMLLKEALRLNSNYPEGLANLGLALQKQADLPGAIKLYKKASAIKLDFLNVLLRLGNALTEQGELQVAIDYYKQALAIDPKSLVVLGSLGNALTEQGELQVAIDYYKQALAIDPRSLVVLNNLGNALKKQGELQAAIDYYKQALAIDPGSLAVLNNLGNALKEQGELQAAIDYYKKALAIDPKSLLTLNNLGNASKEQGELQTAIDYYKQALAIDPGSLAVLNNLGNALKEQGELQAAIDYYKQALAIDPKHLPSLTNLGNALKEQGELQAAIDYYKKVLAMDPNYIIALNNLGNTLKEQGELQEATTLYRKAIFLKEDYWDAHYNLSLSLLLSGDYENGWREHEWRLHENGWREHEWRLHKQSRLHAHPQLKRWDGCNNLSGNKLLLRYDGGFGDTLHFMRYILCLIKRGMSVAFYAQTKLHGLIQASGITKEIYSPEEIYQYITGEWLPLLSLPKCLNVRPDNPLVTEPYIKAPQENISFWKQKLSSENRPIISICWQGNPKTERTSLRGRSFPLKTFAPIIETIDASFLSLQKGFGSEQLTDCRFLDRFVGCQEEINQTWDFVENAAIMMNCDLIITVDTAVAHLAAGLGQPTWLLLHKVPDWRWGMEGDTTFWYPSMRLFRQREHGNWSEVMDRVASALQIVFSHQR